MKNIIPNLIHRESNGKGGEHLVVYLKGLLKTVWMIGCLLLGPEISAQWLAHGPSPTIEGGVIGIVDEEVVGAINAVAPHPSDPNIVYVGSVNGGIWKTYNAMDFHPHWIPLTDFQPSLSLGTIEFDPTDPTNQTLVAGAIAISSLGRLSGPRIGLLRTTDGGLTWELINGNGDLDGLNISGIAPRGNIIVIAVERSGEDSGIWRSIDTGNSWTQVSNGETTGIPAGESFDLASDPNDPNILFTNAGANGVYRSNDAGAIWERVSDASMNAIIGSDRLRSVRIAVGNSNNVFVGVSHLVEGDGNMAGLFWSGNGAPPWTALDLPDAADYDVEVGLTFFSFTADPQNSNIVYFGTYGGPLFRVDASMQAGSQFSHITGSNTASNSAPHADSRDMAFSTNGRLIEVNDGGIYRRTFPRSNFGDWFSMNGDIQTTEIHDITWDSNSDVIIGGTQDNGTQVQLQPFNVRWRRILQGDGGDVAVDDISTPGLSVRYYSRQNFRGFRRATYDENNNLFDPGVEEFDPIVIFGGDDLIGKFITPIELNNVEPSRLIIGGANSIYEAFNQGEGLLEIGPGLTVGGRDPIAYGAIGNPDIIYAGVVEGEGDEEEYNIYVRLNAFPSPLQISPTYPGRRTIQDIVIKPDDPYTAFVIDSRRVYRTSNAGGTWDDISGNLSALSPGNLRSITYSTRYIDGSVIIGGDAGVFIAFGPNYSHWDEMEGLPNAPVFDLEYDEADQMLVAGTMGRGAWAFDMSKNYEYSAKIVCGAQQNGDVLRLIQGKYGTEINIHNPNDNGVHFLKKLALSYPPEEQLPGEIMPISIDVLKADEALKVDCDDLQNNFFPDGFPGRGGYFTGFVVLQSSRALDVTAVYTTGSIDSLGNVISHSSIDVEGIQGKKIKRRIIPPPPPLQPPHPPNPLPRDSLPDLVIILHPDSYDLQPFCSDHSLGYKGKGVRFFVKNQGNAYAPPSVTCVNFDNYGNKCVPTVGLHAGQQIEYNISMPETCPGFSEEFWRCDFTITVNVGLPFAESNAENNQEDGHCAGSR